MKNLINICLFFVLTSNVVFAQDTSEEELSAAQAYSECMVRYDEGAEKIKEAEEKYAQLSKSGKDALSNVPAEINRVKELNASQFEHCQKLKKMRDFEEGLEKLLAAGVGQFLNGAMRSAEESKEKEDVITFTFDEDDMETARVLKDTIRAGSYEGKCLLITVVSNNKSYNRDLAATSIGDLADGAVVLRRNVVDEVGAIAFKAGPNSKITLQEDNSNYFFTSMTEKASGKGIEEFARNAAKAGYLVSYETGYHCLGTVRDADLAKAASEHIKALKAKRDREVEIAKR